MGTYIYIFVAGVVIIGGLSAVSMRSDNNVAEHAIAGVHYKEEARDAAVTGINLTVRRIVNDFGPWVNAGDYQIDTTEYRRADFWTDVQVDPAGTGDSVLVTSVGRKTHLARSGAVVDTTHTIEVKIVRVDLAGGVPPGFDVAILTDGDLSIRGTFEARSLDPTQNADIHANGRLETRGNSFLVEGFGSYTTGERVRNGDNFMPNYDFNGDGPNYMYQDSIPVPTIDVEAFRSSSQTSGVYHDADVAVDQAYINSLAGGSVSSFGDLASALGYPAGVGSTPENPLIFFSEGTIDFTGDVGMDGFGAFVSAGSIHINSNVNITGEIGENFFGRPTTQMGIYTAGGGIINGGANLTASIYINGLAEFKGNGNANITGGAIMRSLDSKLNGSLIITWVGPNEGIVQNFGGLRTIVGPVIAAWAEW